MKRWSKRRSPKMILLWFFESVSWGAPGWPQGPCQGIKSEPKGIKMESRSHPKSANIGKTDLKISLETCLARSVPGWSQRRLRAPCKVKSCWKLYTQSFAELHIYYVLLGLVLDCTHTPPRKNKQKQKHTLSIRWVADSVGKEALRFQQALPRLGGKT